MRGMILLVECRGLCRCAIPARCCRSKGRPHCGLLEVVVVVVVGVTIGVGWVDEACIR